MFYLLFLFLPYEEGLLGLFFSDKNIALMIDADMGGYFAAGNKLLP